MERKLVIGIDFGTDSCRALLVDSANGEELAVSVHSYPRWNKGLYCDASKNQYRQHPKDYVDVLIATVRDVIEQLPANSRDRVVALSFDMTSSTPCLVDLNGTPLALTKKYEENPNAMFILWKDHTAIEEAERITKLAKLWEVDYTQYSGGIYSSEWVWAKVMCILENDEEIRKDAYAWIEHIDWIPALLTGETKPEKVKRSRCSAGHKAMWHESWGGLPSEEFLTTLSPYLKGFRSHLYNETYTCDEKVGYLTEEWADKLGLTTDVAIGIGAIDCHLGAVGAEIKAGTLVKVIGTSTCDIISVPYRELGDKLIAGICGQVDGSVLPGMIGLEAGQSAFGDYYAWFRDLLNWSAKRIIAETHYLTEDEKQKLIEDIKDKTLIELTAEAEKVAVDESIVLATDWINGRRTPDADQNMTATIANLTLGATAPLIYRAIVEATAYGSKAILDRFVENGIQINEVIGVGGISQKSSFVMQTLADVMGMPIKVTRSEQTCALGAAMYAAVVGGVYSSIEEAQQVMGQGCLREYLPQEEVHKKYKVLYEKYRVL